MQITALHSDWTLRSLAPEPDYHQPQLQKPGPLPARVPGFVHLDLVREGVILDPFQRRAEIGAAWVDGTDWSYATTFAWSPTEGAPRRVLRFAGLDTVCEVFLNGERIGGVGQYVRSARDRRDRPPEGGERASGRLQERGGGRRRAAAGLLRGERHPVGHAVVRRARVRAQGGLHERLGLGSPPGVVRRLGRGRASGVRGPHPGGQLPPGAAGERSVPRVGRSDDRGRGRAGVRGRGPDLRAGRVGRA